MVEDGERIAVAVSGGKDSTALLFSLHRILAGRDVEMVAVTVDEGIAGYRDDTIIAARAIAAKLGIEQEIVSFREMYGYDLDEMVVGKKVAPCTYCGVFRKNALNHTAKRLGASKVATGHNLDDEAQSVMMNYLKGDMERLMRFRPRRAAAGTRAPHQAAARYSGKGDRPLLHGEWGLYRIQGVPLCSALSALGRPGYDEQPGEPLSGNPPVHAAGLREDNPDSRRRLGSDGAGTLP